MITKENTDRTLRCVEDSDTSVSAVTKMNGINSNCSKRHIRVIDSDTAPCLTKDSKINLLSFIKSQKSSNRNAMRSRSHFVGIVAVSVLVVLLSQAVTSSSVNDCRGVRYAYSAKGLDLKDVPRQPRQGKNQ